MSTFSRRITLILSSTLLFAAASGCGKGSFFSPVVTSVSAACSPRSVYAGASATCTASLTGTNAFSSAVTWQTTNGVITSSGVFTAANVAGTAIVTATSVEDPSKSATATITVALPPPTITGVAVTCSPSTITTGSTALCAATVSGTQAYSKTVTWNATGGNINAAGVFTGTAPGTVQVTATSTQDSTQKGLATVAVISPANVTVDIIDLPTGILASVLLTDSAGRQTSVTATGTYPVAAGAYFLTENAVVAGGSTYYPLLDSASGSVSTGNTDTVSIDYRNVIPLTTKTFEQELVSGISASPDGLTLTLPASSAVGASLKPGEVLIVPPGDSAGPSPYGMLRKIATSTPSGFGTIVVTTPATLADAFQRLTIDFNQPLAATPLGISQTYHNQSAKPAAVVQNPCGVVSKAAISSTATFAQTIAPTVSVSGSYAFCSDLKLNFDMTGANFFGLLPALNSFSSQLTMNAYDDLKLNAAGSITAQKNLSTKVLPAFKIPRLPIWIVPEITTFVGAKTQVPYTVAVEKKSSVVTTVNADYSNGHWNAARTTPVTQDDFTLPAFLTTGTLSARAYTGFGIALYIEGLIGPKYAPDLYLDTEASVNTVPLWSLTTGLEGPVLVDAGLLGFGLVPSFQVANLFDTNPVTVASGPVLLAVSPDHLTAGYPNSTVTLTGSSFLSTATAQVGGTALTTTFLNDKTLSAVIPAALLKSAGTLAISVDNLGSGGSAGDPAHFAETTGTVPFTVQSAVIILPVTATVVQNASQQFTAAAGGGGGVFFSVQEANGGTVTSSGLYTAPGTTGTYHVIATNTANINDFAVATVTVQATSRPVMAWVKHTYSFVTLNSGIYNVDYSKNMASILSPAQPFTAHTGYLTVGDHTEVCCAVNNQIVSPGDYVWSSYPITFDANGQLVEYSPTRGVFRDIVVRMDKVTEVVSNLSFTPSPLSGGDISIATQYFTYDSRYAALETLHFPQYQWAQTNAYITDADGNGYDDNGEHDKPKP